MCFRINSEGGERCQLLSVPINGNLYLNFYLQLKYQLIPEMSIDPKIMKYNAKRKIQINYLRNYLDFNVGTDGFEPSTLPTAGRDALNLIFALMN